MAPKRRDMHSSVPIKFCCVHYILKTVDFTEITAVKSVLAFTVSVFNVNSGSIY